MHRWKFDRGRRRDCVKCNNRVHGSRYICQGEKFVIYIYMKIAIGRVHAEHRLQHDLHIWTYCLSHRTKDYIHIAEAVNNGPSVKPCGTPLKELRSCTSFTHHVLINKKLNIYNHKYT